MSLLNTIIQGDAWETLRDWPDNFVQCCITSPPYYGLRDYGVSGQIGLEVTPEAYIDNLVEVFREVRRVLRDDGTLWVNIGDSYAGSGKGPTGFNGLGNQAERQGFHSPQITIPAGLKPKDLIGIPWLLAFALRADGWYLRSDIIWHKPNCMPESVVDRPTTAHEHIFLLAKSERYYYDSDAIREPHSENAHHGLVMNRASTFKKQGMVGTHLNGAAEIQLNPAGRNKRSVWTIPTMPYSAAHFATFPPKLIEPCILAGTSPRACEHCGAPWERVTEREKVGQLRPMVRTGGRHPRREVNPGQMDTSDKTGLNHVFAIETTGWQPTCTCTQDGHGRCVVLDPFMGAGTVAMVAIRHGRNWLGIELNPDYIKLAEKRIAYVQQNLWSLDGEVAV